MPRNRLVVPPIRTKFPHGRTTDGRRSEWNEDQQKAFDTLKQRLTEAPVLACPDFSKKFAVQTDASNYGLGGVLSQETEEGERVIAYVSRRLIAPEENYSATEKKCLAII